MLTAAFTALFGIPLTIFGLQLFQNGRNDIGPITTHNSVIIGRYITHSGKSGKTPHYHVTFDTWDEGGAKMSRSVSYNEYSQVIEGRSHIEMSTKPGALRHEWIVGTKIIF